MPNKALVDTNEADDVQSDGTDDDASQPGGEDALQGVSGIDEGTLTMEPETAFIEQRDRTLRELHLLSIEHSLKMDPEWQRNFLWDKKRQSKLIESFLMDIPVPVVYLAMTEGQNYEVIDGLQRLTSVFNFLEGNLKLTGLECLDKLNGKSFEDLPEEFQKKLKNAGIRTCALSPKTSKNLLFLLFERLNRGGVALNEMEIRNCIYRGKLNDLVKKLAVVNEFLKSINQRNLEKRMQDRALVLRFLAFYEKGYEKAQKGLKEFLNDFCVIYQNAPDKKLAEFEEVFKRAVKAGFTIFGESAYRTRHVDKTGAGQWTSSINASVFQVLSVSFTKYDLIQLTQRADAIYEEYLDLLSSDNQWTDCIRASTGDPAKITYAFETWNTRLKLVLAGTRPTDSQRAFSRKLKQELWDHNQQCELCGQAISSVLDAAVDHIEHYWRGGQTIPANARLCHRLCNQKRSLGRD